MTLISDPTCRPALPSDPPEEAVVTALLTSGDWSPIPGLSSDILHNGCIFFTRIPIHKHLNPSIKYPFNTRKEEKEIEDGLEFLESSETERKQMREGGIERIRSGGYGWSMEVKRFCKGLVGCHAWPCKKKKKMEPGCSEEFGVALRLLPSLLFEPLFALVEMASQPA